jgi:hypothetical protein
VVVVVVVVVAAQQKKVGDFEGFKFGNQLSPHHHAQTRNSSHQHKRRIQEESVSPYYRQDSRLKGRPSPHPCLTSIRFIR